MTKIWLLIVAGICSVLAEPPVNTYLPASNAVGTPGGFGQPSSQYGTPSGQYSAPGAGLGVPSSQYGGPSSQYSGLSTQSGAPSSQYDAPSSQYGSPGSESNSYTQGGYSAGGYGNVGEDQYSEPAKYDFRYDVNAPEYNVEFGHQESRDGDDTRGSYYVLLPDGRRQLVQYTADQGGYKPVISYEDTGRAFGDGKGGYGSAGGYSQGGYSAPSSAGYSAPSAGGYSAGQQSGSGPY